jgi:hypothetical protein
VENLYIDRLYCIYTVTYLAGALFYFTEDGICTEVLNTEGVPLKKILYHEHKDNLIVMTEDLNVGQFQVNPNGQVTEIMKVRTLDVLYVEIVSSRLCHSQGN